MKLKSNPYSESVFTTFFFLFLFLFFIFRLTIMEVSGRNQADSEDVQTVKTEMECDPCLLDAKTVNAERFCTVCDEFLCDNCARAHKNSKATRNHKLLTRDEMPRKKLAAVQKFCSKHDDKQIKYFCERHDQLCCSACQSTEHRQCKIAYVNEIAGEYVASKEYQNLLKQIKILERKLIETRLQSEKNCEDVNQCLTTLISDIQHFRSQVNTSLDKLEKQIREEAQKIKTDDLKSMESISTQSESIQKHLSEMSSTLESLEKYKQNQQLFISSKQYLADVMEINRNMEVMTLKNHIKKYEFQIAKDILNSVDTCCKLKVFDFSYIMYKEPKQIKAKFVKNINVQHKQDTRCSCLITGSDLLNYYTLALTDRDNSSVKLVDLHTDTITSCLPLAVKPRDLTCMDSNTMVATCETNLTFVKFDGKLSVMKEVPMEDDCWRITSHKHKLFVTCTEKPCVKILNSAGTVLHTIQNNSQGQNLFFQPRGIATSTDGQTIYVSDWEHHTVTSYSLTGEPLNVYRHKDLKNPLGLTMIENKFIIVCGGWSHNLHAISGHCEHIRIVLKTKEPGFPWTVLYNRKNNLLYVSYGRGTYYMSVYKLE